MKKRSDNSEKISLFSLFAEIPVFIYLLPIPILQNFLFDPRNFREHITSYALSFILFAAFGGIAAADYRMKRYKILPEHAYIREGIFLRSRFHIPYERLQSVIVQSSVLSRLFSTVKIQLNTSATKAKKGDAEFYLPIRKAKKLISEIYDDLGYIQRYYHAKNTRIFFMAAIWSNPVSGLLILSPLIGNTGKILGNELRNELLESFDFSKYLVYIGISPTTAVIVYILFFCYAVSVCADFVRNADFSCTSFQNGIVIKRGIIKKTLFFTNCSKINAITLSQSLFMFPFRRYSAYIHTVGSGKAKGDRSLLIAAERKSALKNLLPQLLKDFDLHFDFNIRPTHEALGAYLRLPLVLIFTDIIFCVIPIMFNVSEDMFFSFMLFTVSALVIWCFFRAYAFSKSGLSVNPSCVYLRFYKRITLRSTIIPIGKIQFCVKKQNIFQKKKGTCNIKIYILGEKRTFVEIKHLKETDADDFICEMNKYT